MINRDQQKGVATDAREQALEIWLQSYAVMEGYRNQLSSNYETAKLISRL